MKWQPHESETLRQLYAQRVALKVIAFRMGRSQGAIKRHAHNLGIRHPSRDRGPQIRHFNMRLTEDEYATLHRRAAQAGMTATSWLVQELGL